MKTEVALILAMTGVLLMAGCSTPGQKVGGGGGSRSANAATGVTVDHGMAPLVLAGSQLQFRDLHGSYVYTFQAKGQYRFAAIHQSGQPEARRAGRYRYTINTPGVATIAFDHEATIRLSFNSPLAGVGTVQGNVRPIAFTITRPEGE